MTARLLCFKAVRELLMNVVKYAGTAQATLALEQAPAGMLRITVRDQGEGFDPAVEHDGSGHSNLERRLAMIGGRLTVDSAPGGGTVATLLAPLGMGTIERAVLPFEMHGSAPDEVEDITPASGTRGAVT